ncbi:TRAP transporter substrate-binding protein DctP [Acrocarpospora catenulata]|uniref:TRAP transporter substrate-binding protein DctP n=1 Tax=Acrocarpospora catenulata TaxID=2836182 RepID=UPI001BDAE282|nr:TRAP transporter substrate-binding protein DctP [Acrocarpospora catenulata]
MTAARTVWHFTDDTSTYHAALTAMFTGTGVEVARGRAEADVLHDVRASRSMGAVVPVGLLADICPAAILADLPYLFASRAYAMRFWDGAGRDTLRADLAPHGLDVWGVFDGGTRHFVTKTPLIDDFAGRTVRTMPGSLLADVLRILGAHPVPVPGSDFAQAARTGRFDACERSASNVLDYGLHEWFPYLTLTAHAHAVAALVVNTAVAGDTLAASRVAAAERVQRHAYQARDEAALRRLESVMRVRREASPRLVAALGDAVARACPQVLESVRKESA